MLPVKSPSKPSVSRLSTSKAFRVSSVTSSGPSVGTGPPPITRVELVTRTLVASRVPMMVRKARKSCGTVDPKFV
jgi:hypothetical protein